MDTKPNLRLVRPTPANDLHEIFRPRPVFDDRPDLYERLCSEAWGGGHPPARRSNIIWRTFYVALCWGVVLGCIWLIVSGAL